MAVTEAARRGAPGRPPIIVSRSITREIVCKGFYHTQKSGDELTKLATDLFTPSSQYNSLL